jgi:DNA invertase Pin-like site-specific DNA recombinase
MSAKAAIWVRVSTDRQHEDNQIPDLERLCQHRGWEIARRYEIADASAYRGEHRQALQRMLDDAHRGEFSVLVVWAVDRLCRQGIEELLRLIRELRERNVSLVSHQEPWLNGTDATTELLAAVAAWVATRSPSDAPNGFALASRAAEPRGNRWAAPPQSEAKTSAHVAPTGTRRRGPDARQPNRRRDLCSVTRGTGAGSG